ncbi:hypothetical protein C4588_01660 [Candidatus Parcubacteria bacterium]|nr:MAG: hypothetical protein C4588_01660 [Candidatus Parcubacteria bacterium]
MDPLLRYLARRAAQLNTADAWKVYAIQLERLAGFQNVEPLAFNEMVQEGQNFIRNLFDTLLQDPNNIHRPGGNTIHIINEESTGGFLHLICYVIARDAGFTQTQMDVRAFDVVADYINTEHFPDYNVLNWEFTSVIVDEHRNLLAQVIIEVEFQSQG